MGGGWRMADVRGSDGGQRTDMGARAGVRSCWARVGRKDKPQGIPNPLGPWSTVPLCHCAAVWGVLSLDYVHLWGETAAAGRGVRENTGSRAAVQCRVYASWGEASQVALARGSDPGSGASPSANKQLPGMRRPYRVPTRGCRAIAFVCHGPVDPPDLAIRPEREGRDTMHPLGAADPLGARPCAPTWTCPWCVIYWTPAAEVKPGVWILVQ